MTARDHKGTEIRVGGYVFIDRERESFRVISITPLASNQEAFWIKVDDPEKGLSSYFDISVKVDESRTPEVDP